MLPAVLVFLLSTDPALATSLLQQGLVALKEGHTVEARKRLEEASQNDPKNAYVWVSLAETYRRLQEGRLASDAAEHASKLAPDDAVVSHGLAIYYGEVEQWRRAGELERRFAESETRVTGEPWFDHGKFSRVDAVYGPVFRYFDVFDTIADFGILSGKPKLSRWRKSLAARPSVRSAVTADYPALLRDFLGRRNSWISGLQARAAA